MKGWRMFSAGLVTGVFMGSVFLAQAAPLQAVTAYLADDVQFTFDGSNVQLPYGYTALTYEGRTYVPARFVAESLGASVDWDELSRTVSFTSKECPTVEEDEDEDDSNDDKDKPTIKYKNLPTKEAVFTDCDVTVNSVLSDNKRTMVYVELENDDFDDPVMLDQSKSVAIVDDEEYKTEDLAAGFWDYKWYDDVHKDDSIEGYIAFPKMPKDTDRMSLSLTFVKNDASQEERVVDFDIKFDILDSDD